MKEKPFCNCFIHNSMSLLADYWKKTQANTSHAKRSLHICFKTVLPKNNKKGNVIFWIKRSIAYPVFDLIKQKKNWADPKFVSSPSLKVLVVKYVSIATLIYLDFEKQI